jgi:methionine synthase I (cobalamin-dependent)
VTFLETLNSGRVLLMDGGMGTELQKRGLSAGENATAWNLLHPERVSAVHEAYLAAGAEVCLTNTFLANDRGLSHTLREARLQDLWRAAYDLIGDRAFRIAALGPDANDPIREFSASNGVFVMTQCDEAQPHRCVHFPHAILLETYSTPRVRYALARLRGDVPLLLSLSYRRDNRGKLTTISGHAPEWFAARARKYGVSALGVNCGRDIGLDDIVEIVRRCRRATDLPLFARPNAGTPRRVGKRWVYPLTPGAMAARLPELLEAGVSMIGGCCGTTPEHIAALRPVVERWNTARR